MERRARYEDPGVDLVAEFHAAFGMHMPPEPWGPELSRADVACLASYAREMLRLSRQLKAAAAEANGTGRAALGLMLVRLQLLVEEPGELAEAMAERDLVKVLDALTDISYVADGTYLTFGLGHLKPAADAEVHRSNMSKLGPDGRPIIHESGRVVKGPGYSPPDLRSVLDLAELAEDV